MLHTECANKIKEVKNSFVLWQSVVITHLIVKFNISREHAMAIFSEMWVL